MNEFKKQEENRMAGLHDTYMKILVYEISSLRNLQYDIDRISKRVNLLDFSEDLEEFSKQKLSKVYFFNTLTYH